MDVETTATDTAQTPPLTVLQLHHLANLQRTIRLLRELHGHPFKPDWQQKLLLKALYAYWVDCGTGGVGEYADLLLHDYRDGLRSAP